MEAARHQQDVQRAADYLMQYRIAIIPHSEHPGKVAVEVIQDIRRLTEVTGEEYTPDGDKLDKKALAALKKSMRR